MTNWPTAPLIRINGAHTVNGAEIENSIALRDRDGDYRIAERWLLHDKGDRIAAWEEVTPVPTAALKRLQNAFRGVDVIHSLEPPLLEVLSHLPADNPSPLDRALALACDLNGPRITPKDTTARRLAILLECISFAHASPNKETELTEIARTCADWLDIINPSRIGLNDIAVSAQEVENIPADGERRYLSLTYRFAQAATLIGEGGNGSSDIKDLGAYALAWAAQIIKEEEK